MQVTMVIVSVYSNRNPKTLYILSNIEFKLCSNYYLNTRCVEMNSTLMVSSVSPFFSRG